MKLSLTQLPTDLVNQIWVNMETSDQINLISTSWYFRMLLGREFFETVKVKNSSNQRVDSSLAFSKGKSASLVRHVL